MKSKQQNNINKVINTVKGDLEIIENLLQDTIIGHTNLITQIGNNIFSAGGKRIRPILSILSGKLFNYNQQKYRDFRPTLTFASSIFKVPIKENLITKSLFSKKISKESYYWSSYYKSNSDLH